LETPKIVPGLEMHVVRPSREELENVWRERLNEALRQYRIAKLDASTALIQYRQGEMPTPDGNFAFRKAAEAENRAFAEYTRLLSIFNDLVLEGKLPDSGSLTGIS